MSAMSANMLQATVRALEADVSELRATCPGQIADLQEVQSKMLEEQGRFFASVRGELRDLHQRQNEHSGNLEKMRRELREEHRASLESVQAGLRDLSQCQNVLHEKLQGLPEKASDEELEGLHKHLEILTGKLEDLAGRTGADIDRFREAQTDSSAKLSSLSAKLESHSTKLASTDAQMESVTELQAALQEGLQKCELSSSELHRNMQAMDEHQVQVLQRQCQKNAADLAVSAEDHKVLANELREGIIRLSTVIQERALRTCEQGKRLQVVEIMRESDLKRLRDLEAAVKMSQSQSAISCCSSPRSLISTRSSDSQQDVPRKYSDLTILTDTSLPASPRSALETPRNITAELPA
eukprot:gnl/TRDRNA2_/TRDRNA2_84075_c0_seq1.p1 gnl/TRDRNA2_/TRDRNA2_84075_c0~~gnl/TRDRNA2_/TRDRNA2_84075_c0_seq1.p1  ORF type:complete len:354 (+),score=68.41 gnl/TRDRNA2_/TRDRNA2_84075_c0_seq1:86-1147(+)